MTTVPTEINAAAVKNSATDKHTPMMQQYLRITFFLAGLVEKKAHYLGQQLPPVPRTLPWRSHSLPLNCRQLLSLKARWAHANCITKRPSNRDCFPVRTACNLTWFSVSSTD